MSAALMGTFKTFNAFLHCADEGTLSWLLVEAGIGALSRVRANTLAARYVLPASVVRGIPTKQWDTAEALRWENRFKVSTAALAIFLKEADLIDDRLRVASRKFASFENSAPCMR